MLLRLAAVARELDPARLAAPADLNLGLDDDREAELLGGLDGLAHRRGMPSLRHRNGVFLEELLSLVFEEVHWGDR